MKDEDLAWCSAQLNTLTLTEEVSGDLAVIIGEMASRDEITEFMTDLLGKGRARSSKVQNFISGCLERFGARDDEVAYRKEKFDEGVKKGGKPSGSGKQKKQTPKFDDIIMTEPDKNASKKKSPKKTHYIKIISDNTLNSVLLPGRNICHCLAQRHGLVNNCFSCGRIVCEQEGEGPCMFCGVLVANPDNTARIASQSKKGREIEYKLQRNVADNFKPISHFNILDQTNIQTEAYNKAVEQKMRTEAYNRAVEHKQKLLEYDRSDIHRSKVVDDESDYFQNTRWLSAAEKELVEKKATERAEAVHSSRLQSKVTLDFMGRKIVENATKELNSEFGVIYDAKSKREGQIRRDSTEFEPVFIDQPRPRYEQPNQHIKTPKSELNQKKAAIRNQDKDFKLLRDEGMCLTMHQPWASLLVAGIKKIEGRNWYSTHRGRLWIHSASKQTSTAEVRAIEEQYRQLQGNDVMFPEYYPESSIIGCVFVEDVVPYFDNEEENSSEYLFMCKDPKMLVVPIKCRGQNKVWKLGKQEHNTVLDQLF